jgi:hypothetical protein
MREPITTPITQEPHAKRFRERDENTDVISDLANAVRQHIATDGADPVLREHEEVVLASEPGSVRHAAGVLLLAHDEAVNGDRHLANRLVLGAARSLVGDDPDLAVIERFYAG